MANVNIVHGKLHCFHGQCQCCLW